MSALRLLSVRRSPETQRVENAGMKILIISDIHSNYEALLAVAKAERDADHVWCLGDLVDYGPQPAEVVQWVRHHAQMCVRGNHDHALAFREDCRCGKRFRALSRASREMNRALLSPDQIAYLQLLPLTEEIVLENCRFRLAHATPSGDMYRYLTPGVTDIELGVEFAGVFADVVFCGHTHFPMIRKVGSKLFVNPGSVGQPRDGDPRASYAVWDDGVVKLRRAKYDISQTVNKLRTSKLQGALAERLAQILRDGGADEGNACRTHRVMGARTVAPSLRLAGLRGKRGRNEQS
jgi:putative phosphoesterase